MLRNPGSPYAYPYCAHLVLGASYITLSMQQRTACRSIAHVSHILDLQYLLLVFVCGGDDACFILAWQLVMMLLLVDCLHVHAITLL